jgi:hypothetical protein
MTAIMFVFWTADLGIWIICLFPIWGILMKTLQTKSVNGQRFHRAPTVVLYCLKECLTNFVVNLLLAESGTTCLLQRAENCLITSSNWPNQFPTFHEFWIVTCDPFSGMPVFHHPMQLPQACSYPVFPMSWTLIGNSSLPFMQSSFAHSSRFQYRLAVHKRLSLVFSHKTEHSKII